MSENEVSYSAGPADRESAERYINKTLNDGELSCQIKWGFDEQQADPFHRAWTEEYFKRCLSVLVEHRSES